MGYKTQTWLTSELNWNFISDTGVSLTFQTANFTLFTWGYSAYYSHLDSRSRLPKPQVPLIKCSSSMAPYRLGYHCWLWSTADRNSNHIHIVKVESGGCERLWSSNLICFQQQKEAQRELLLFLKVFVFGLPYPFQFIQVFLYREHFLSGAGETWNESSGQWGGRRHEAAVCGDEW